MTPEKILFNIKFLFLFHLTALSKEKSKQDTFIAFILAHTELTAEKLYSEILEPDSAHTRSSRSSKRVRRKEGSERKSSSIETAYLFWFFTHLVWSESLLSFETNNPEKRKKKVACV